VPRPPERKVDERVDRRRALGVKGEDAVAAWYQAKGYEIVARNWRCREGEVDLIVRNGRVFVFCEVKTRTSVAFGAPVEAVTMRKQLRLRKLAAKWLRESTERRGDVRFDVASVLAGEIEVVEGAF
jgi:putative endonuclease